MTRNYPQPVLVGTSQMPLKGKSAKKASGLSTSTRSNLEQATDPWTQYGSADLNDIFHHTKAGDIRNHPNGSPQLNPYFDWELLEQIKKAHKQPHSLYRTNITGFLDENFRGWNTPNKSTATFQRPADDSGSPQTPALLSLPRTRGARHPSPLGTP